jgi:hypothetical protein
MGASIAGRSLRPLVSSFLWPLAGRLRFLALNLPLDRLTDEVHSRLGSPRAEPMLAAAASVSGKQRVLIGYQAIAKILAAGET